MIPASSSRRRFLRTAATLTAASTVPGWFEAEAKESRRPRVPLAANDRP
ncbi:MAG: hypothetical protein RLZ45_136, partial [Verrucomicrobiota bacterium]